MSQFSATPSVPLTLTQAARQFKDIVPSHSFTRFCSPLTFAQLLPMLTAALHRLSVPIVAPSAAAREGREQCVSIRIKTVDARQQPLSGNVLVEKVEHGGPLKKNITKVRYMHIHKVFMSSKYSATGVSLRVGPKVQLVIIDVLKACRRFRSLVSSTLYERKV